MIAGLIRGSLKARPVIAAAVFMIALVIALLLGHWLAILQAPLTRDVVAQDLLESGTPEKAAHLFEIPIWQGVALYRAGRYHRAIGAFVTDDSLTGLYNMGNAYARLGLYQSAITAYETVLERRPDHEDAYFNLQLVRAAAERAQDLEEASRETENAGSWEDGQESQAHGQPNLVSDDQGSEGARDDMEAPPEGEPGAAETEASEADLTASNTNSSDRDSEKTEASVFSVSNNDDREADDLSSGEHAPEDIEVIGGKVDRVREEAMADEILLRRIEDDPAVVLRARLDMALRRQRSER